MGQSIAMKRRRVARASKLARRVRHLPLAFARKNAVDKKSKKSKNTSPRRKQGKHGSWRGLALPLTKTRKLRNGLEVQTRRTLQTHDRGSLSLNHWTPESGRLSFFAFF